MKELEPRDYQDRVMEKLVGIFMDGYSSAQVNSPTGSGKTVMGLAFARHLEDYFGYRTNWCAMRRNLLTQVREANADFFQCQDLQVVSMFEKNPPPADLLVIDECQHEATTSCLHVAESCGARFILGLSATPFRTDRLKLSFQRVVRDAGIHRLITDGYLCKFQHYNIERWTPEVVAETYLREPLRWGKTVVFFRTIAECVRFASLAGEGGIHCEVVTGTTDRESQLDDFDRGKFTLIANPAVLTEGFDSPDLTTVFVRDASRLPTIQMAGRGLRTCKGKTHCNIVQSRNAEWQFSRTATPMKSFACQGDGWLQLGGSELVESTASRISKLIASSSVVLPRFITTRRIKNRIPAV